jgi:hypothetical protein
MSPQMNRHSRTSPKLFTLGVVLAPGALVLMSVLGCGPATSISSPSPVLAATLAPTTAATNSVEPTTSAATPTHTVAPTKVSVPDGRIRLGGTGYPGKAVKYKGPFAGNNVYNITGAGQSETKESFSELEGQYFAFDISIQNDGAHADRFAVKATGTATAAWTVKYFHGATNITSAVVAGTYRTSSLAPGAAYLITARVTVGQSGDISRLVTVSSVADATKKDAVKFGIKEIACGC